MLESEGRLIQGIEPAGKAEMTFDVTCEKSILLGCSKLEFGGLAEMQRGATAVCYDPLVFWNQ